MGNENGFQTDWRNPLIQWCPKCETDFWGVQSNTPCPGCKGPMEVFEEAITAFHLAGADAALALAEERRYRNRYGVIPLTERIDYKLQQWAVNAFWVDLRRVGYSDGT